MKVMLKKCRLTFSCMKGLRKYSQEAVIERTRYKRSYRILFNSDLTTDTANAITTICINRPATRNSLNCETLIELGDALRAFDNDSNSKVVVLAGTCGNLSSGFDLHEINKYGYNALKDAARPLLRRPLTDKPSVAAVAGFAVGEGLELALACDLRCIEDTAIMGFLGRRFGVPTSLNGGARLASLVGLSRALDLVVNGKVIDGTIANEWGLAARFVATGTGIGQAINLAWSIVKLPQAALIRDKLVAVDSQLTVDDAENKARNEATIMSLQGLIQQEMEEGVPKFQHGIGRHAKFYNLTQRELKKWEYENDEQLV